MAGVAFALENLLAGATYTSSCSVAGDGLDAVNVEDGERPQRPFGHGDTLATTTYRVTNSNKFLDFTENGGSEINASLTTGIYTGTALRSHIESVLNAAGGLTYVVAWDLVGDGLWSVAAASGTIEFLFDTGANAANSVAGLLGYGSADTGAAASQTGESARYGNMVQLVVDVGADISPALFWVQLYGDAGTDYGGSDLKVYGNSSDLGTNPGSWAASATIELDVSPRGTEADITPAQLALNTDDHSARYWCFAWEYEDSSAAHMVGLFQAFDPVTSENYNVQEIAAHGLDEATADLGLGADYTVIGDQAYFIRLDFEDWPTADWRAVVLATVKRTRGRAFGFLLEYDRIWSGAVDAENSTDHGFVFWATRQGGHSGGYGGALSEYVTDSIDLLQRL